MKIVFIVNEVFDGWTPTDTRLGGTEESIVRWSEELVKRGHAVAVFQNGFAKGHNGVQYWPRNTYIKQHQDRYAEFGEKYSPDTVYINIKSSDIPPLGGRPTLYLTNETNADTLDLSLYDAVIWPSQWCIDHIPVNNPKTFILPHGYDPTRIYPDKKVPKQCFYASSPDRGLDTLLMAWPKVYENHPDATLVLTYGGHSELPGVINLGEADEITMDEIYNSSDIWCHPCSGGELFCITGKKAQAAGCIPVIIPTMALSETVERGFKTDKENYAQSLIEVLGMSMDARDFIRKDVIKHANALSWEQSTDKLLEIINNVLQ
jgi:glycosyltransferase involved in cell wall biosynthesis